MTPIAVWRDHLAMEALRAQRYGLYCDGQAKNPRWSLGCENMVAHSDPADAILGIEQQPKENNEVKE